MNGALLPLSAAGTWADPKAWFAVVGAYLLGSVPFGLLLAKSVKGVDLRSIGSGNIGTSNAVRAMGRGWGLLVFVLDFVKGWLPVAVCARLVGVDAQHAHALQLACGTAAVLGHCFSLYLRFKGGKGVATGCGAIVAIDPLVFLAGGVVWLVTRYTTRYLGLASILMGATFPIAMWVRNGSLEFVLGAILLFVLILVRHRSNIQRMLDGTEPRAGEKRATPQATRPHG